LTVNSDDYFIIVCHRPVRVGQYSTTLERFRGTPGVVRVTVGSD